MLDAYGGDNDDDSPLEDHTSLSHSVNGVQKVCVCFLVATRESPLSTGRR